MMAAYSLATQNSKPSSRMAGDSVISILLMSIGCIAAYCMGGFAGAFPFILMSLFAIGIDGGHGDPKS